MKGFSTRLKYVLAGGLLSIASAFVQTAEAQPPATLWTNTPITFTQYSTNSDGSTNINDFLTSEVTLTRFGTGTLQNVTSSPTPDTVLWGQNPSGNINNYAALSYATMDVIRLGANMDLQAVLLSTPWVMQLQNEQIYIPVTFTEWTRKGGPFAYIRGTAPPAPPPTPVKLFSPMISGSSFIFSYSNASPGSTYVVQASSNLSSWTAVSTNVAAASIVSVTNAVTSGNRYFRVGASASH